MLGIFQLREGEHNRPFYGDACICAGTQRHASAAGTAFCADPKGMSTPEELCGLEPYQQKLLHGGDDPKRGSRLAHQATAHGALTDKIDDRNLFMKGIGYSYYDGQEE